MRYPPEKTAAIHDGLLCDPATHVFCVRLAGTLVHRIRSVLSPEELDECARQFYLDIRELLEQEKGRKPARSRRPATLSAAWRGAGWPMPARCPRCRCNTPRAGRKRRRKTEFRRNRLNRRDPTACPLWGHASCLYSLIASSAVNGSGTRSGRAATEATPADPEHPRRGLDHEVRAGVGDMKKATQGVAVFHWPRLQVLRAPG
jgi:hypothetical protein